MPTNPTDSWGMGRLDPYMEPDEAGELPINLIASTTFAAGTLLGELTSTPGTFKAYASGNVDGSQSPKLVLRHACVTDAAGFITYGSSITAGQGQDGATIPSKVTDAFYCGIFKTTDIVGLDAGAVTALGARIISGTLANGIIAIPGV
jgi:hypothetical protein